MNLSPDSFYHKGDELTVVNKQQFHCFTPLKAVQYVLKRLRADIGMTGKNNNLIENTLILTLVAARKFNICMPSEGYKPPC